MNRFRVVRGILIVLAVLVGIVLVASLGVRVYGAQRLRVATARYEREHGPLSLLTFVRHRIPAEENSVTWLRPGILAVVLFPSDRALVGTLAAKPGSEWTPEDLAKIEEVLDRNRPAFEILSRARALTASDWEIPYQDGNSAKLPNLLAAMNTAKLLAAGGRRALARGDLETSIAAAETLGALARSHEAEAATIVLLIGVAIERIELGLIHEIATSSPLDRGALGRLEAALCHEDLAEAFRRTVRGEAAALTHDIHSESYVKELPRVIPRTLAIGVAKLAAAAALEGNLDAQAGLTDPIRAPLNPPGGSERYDDWWWRKLVVLYGPHIRNAAARGTAVSSTRALARVAIELRRHALASGGYPESFGTPVDPLSGDPFAYRTEPSGTAEVRSTTTTEILRSIYPVGIPLYEELSRWTLPAPTVSATPSASRSSTRAR